MESESKERAESEPKRGKKEEESRYERIDGRETSIESQMDYDLKFVFNDKSINCRKSFLESRNKKFYDFWAKYLPKRDQNNEIHVKSDSFESMNAWIEWLFGNKPEINGRNVTDVMKLAVSFDEPVLRDLCGQYLEINSE